MGLLDMATGGLLSFALSDYNRSKQKGDAKEAQREQIEGAKELTDYQKNAEWNLWKKTGPVGMLREAKNAGLSPGVIAGKGGIGGGIAGGGAPMPSMKQIPDANAATSNQLNSMMSMANIALLESQARKNNVETEKIAGVDTAKVESDINVNENKIKEIAAGIKNTEASTKLLKAQADIAGIDATVKGSTLQDQINTIHNIATKAGGEAKQALVEGRVSEATEKDAIKLIHQEAVNKAIQATAMWQDIKLSNAKINEISAGIQQKWAEINIQQDKTGYEHSDRLKAIEEYCKNALKTAGIIAAGQLVGDIVKIATRQIPKGSITTRTNGAGETTSESYTRPN